MHALANSLLATSCLSSTSSSTTVSGKSVMQETEGAYGRWLSADVVCHELAHQWFGDYVTCLDFDNIVGEFGHEQY